VTELGERALLELAGYPPGDWVEDEELLVSARALTFVSARLVERRLLRGRLAYRLTAAGRRHAVFVARDRGISMGALRRGVRVA